MNLNGRHIFVVGVTGGIGSGKTEVCRILEQAGVPVLGADAISKSISDSSASVRTAIVKLLGKAAYRSDKKLDRAFVASRIFNDAGLRKRLEQLLHPAVERELERQLVRLSKEGCTLAVVEAALIYEAGLDQWLDAVVVVDAEEELRIQRVRERDHTDPESIRARMNSQLPASEKVGKAEFVILNNGSRKELERNVRFIHSLLVTMSHGASPS